MIGTLPTNTLQNNNEHRSSHRKIERLSQLNSRITLWINLDSTCSLSPAVPLGFLSLYNKADPWGPFPKIRPELNQIQAWKGKKKKICFSVCDGKSHKCFLLLKENKPAFIREQFGILICCFLFSCTRKYKHCKTLPVLQSVGILPCGFIRSRISL